MSFASQIPVQYPLPRPLPDVRVRVLKATFLVKGRPPSVGETVSVPADIAAGLVAIGKAELLNG